MKSNSKAATQQRGFTITQMVITIAIIAVVSSFGVLGIKTARAEFRLQSAARLFASYIEKVRADSIRRQATPGNESSVEISGEGTTNYAITMDFGTGAVETRTFDLEPGIEFGTAAQKVAFDWRGRLTKQCEFTKSCVFQIRSVYLGRNIPVDVSGSGDITVDEQHFPDKLIPAIAMSSVPNDVDNSTPTPTPTPSPSPAGTPPLGDSGGDPDAVDSTDPTPTPTPSPTPTPNGNGNGSDGNNGNDQNNGKGNPSPSPTPSVDPGSGGQQCASTITPPSLFLSQSDPTKQTGTATFTMTNGTGVRIISATQAGNGNSLSIALSLQRIDGNGTSVISVTTKHGAGNRGVFTVKVEADPACGSPQQLSVTVDN